MFIPVRSESLHGLISNLLDLAVRKHGSINIATETIKISLRTYHRWKEGSSIPDTRSFIALCKAAGHPVGFHPPPDDLNKGHGELLLTLAGRDSR